MSKRAASPNVPASVRQRLLNLAVKNAEPFGLTLNRYALERLLYRLACSFWHDNFVLKGAMLFALWYARPHRPTKDLDLLARGENTVASVEQVFRALCVAAVEEDGLSFNAGTVRGEDIREGDRYHGVRIKLVATLAGARIPLQIDVGFGDTVTPAPEEVSFPTLLEFPAPRILAYTRYSVVAEKFQAMVTLGQANSRMKDFVDIWMMARELDFDGQTLCQALTATFGRRQISMPAETPLALSDEFHQDPVKIVQWAAFMRRSGLQSDQTSLAEVVDLLRSFLLAPALAVAQGALYARRWRAGGPWQNADVAV
jgi:hypothetical protein